ncbi:innexin inx2-like [Homarus americanus]|uniref:innexin inx2-like n=1 Tax=Homarus americanus TaxID=6706 RepID=UPI001C487F7C|nr:innexin inx2-like [Homarus americanus]XP_042203603.1 innexin inx2-like [Homarus americanus]XP_042203690.1 innexin inx2-like [Homarus americanus]XP_042203763.1 innexin inx2-like [Homarus americanus]XP_042203843.1 innexin inx2-like [Homarus americanus]
MAFRAISSIKVKVELKPVVDNMVFRLHYRYTYIIYMVSMLLCTLYDAIGNKIECMTGVDSDAFKEMVNSYCFIMGTFTVDRLHGVKVGLEVPHPGVGPQQPGESITYHTYYQWVPFVLFVQGVMFYVPHWLWKGREGGLFRQVIQDLSIRDYLGSDLKTYFSREKKFEVLSKYIYHHMDAHKKWAYSFFVCEFLNLGVAVATLFFTNWFLGGEFLTYGADVMEVIGLDPENRTDPMSYVFPRMAKCTFKSFGSSGTIQVRDVMCLIATNIINEKIYVFLWVWLVMLTTLTSAFLIYRLLTILFPFFRHFLLKTRVNHEMSRDVTVVMKMSSLSDWFLVYSLGKNMEQTVFSEFIHYFAGELSTSTDTLSMDEKEKMKL